MVHERRLTRRTAIVHGAVATSMVWTAPIVRSIALRGVPGTPPPSTSNTTGTTAKPVPTLSFNARSPCDLNLAFGFISATASNLPPNESLALAASFGDEPPRFFLRFTTDANGRATLGGTGSEVPFTSSVWIWRDDDLDGELDDGEEVLIAGRVVADQPCVPPAPVVGVEKPMGGGFASA